jgi:hypothetical protein
MLLTPGCGDLAWGRTDTERTVHDLYSAICLSFYFSNPIVDHRSVAITTPTFGMAGNVVEKSL